MTSRHQTNAKNHERRTCVALGGTRNGPNPGSDCVGVPYSVEAKRMKKLALRADHLAQAKAQSVVDKKPWILVLQEHGQEAYVVMPFDWFVDTLHPLYVDYLDPKVVVHRYNEQFGIA